MFSSKTTMKEQLERTHEQNIALRGALITLTKLANSYMEVVEKVTTATADTLMELDGEPAEFIMDDKEKN